MSNQTPKYKIGDEIYVIWDNKPIKTKIARIWQDPDVKDYFCYQTQPTTGRIHAANIYATKEDIIKDLP